MRREKCVAVFAYHPPESCICQRCRRSLLFVGQIEQAGDVALGDDEHVRFSDGVCVRSNRSRAEGDRCTGIGQGGSGSVGRVQPPQGGTQSDVSPSGKTMQGWEGRFTSPISRRLKADIAAQTTVALLPELPPTFADYLLRALDLATPSSLVGAVERTTRAAIQQGLGHTASD